MCIAAGLKVTDGEQAGRLAEIYYARKDRQLKNLTNSGKQISTM